MSFHFFNRLYYTHFQFSVNFTLFHVLILSKFQPKIMRSAGLEFLTSRTERAGSKSAQNGGQTFARPEKVAHFWFVGVSTKILPQPIKKYLIKEGGLMNMIMTFTASWFQSNMSGLFVGKFRRLHFSDCWSFQDYDLTHRNSHVSVPFWR